MLQVMQITTRVLSKSISLVLCRFWGTVTLLASSNFPTKCLQKPFLFTCFQRKSIHAVTRQMLERHSLPLSGSPPHSSMFFEQSTWLQSNKERYINKWTSKQLKESVLSHTASSCLVSSANPMKTTSCSNLFMSLQELRVQLQIWQLLTPHPTKYLHHWCLPSF